MDVRLDQPDRRTGLVLIRRVRRNWIWLAGSTAIALTLGFWVYRAMRQRVSDADLIWKQAEQDFQAGQYPTVEKGLDRLKSLREPTPLDWMLRAQLAMVQNRSDEAIADLLRVPDEHEMAAQARLLAGQIELRRDRVRFAEHAFRAALKLDPRLLQAHRELIFIYGMQLRRAELNSEFLAVSKLTSLTFENVFHWCLLRNNSWEPGEAVESLSRYIAADPEDRWSRLALAENERRMGLNAEAESVLSVLPSRRRRGNRAPGPDCPGSPAVGSSRRTPRPGPRRRPDTGAAARPAGAGAARRAERRRTISRSPTPPTPRVVRPSSDCSQPTR